MDRIKRLCLTAICLLFISGCAGEPRRPLVDPTAIRFPLVEDGALDIDGTVVGQPRTKDGVIYFATREGFLTAVVVPARQVFWRFKADHHVSAGPEVGEEHVLFRDDGHVLYVLDFNGSLVLKRSLGAVVTTAVREHLGRICFGTEDGKIQALDSAAPDGNEPAWTYRASAPLAAGPVFDGERVLFGASDGRLMAFDRSGMLAWEFVAKGSVMADPVVAGGRIYFGAEEKSFFCLDAATGKKKWSRRLQGAPLHPAFVRGPRVAVAASNSVVYFLSRKGGSILSWEPVPSRVVHELSWAGPALMISSAGPRLHAYDLKTGRRFGEHIVPGTLMAAPVWLPPAMSVVLGDEVSGRQRLVFLVSRAVENRGLKK